LFPRAALAGCAKARRASWSRAAAPARTPSQARCAFRDAQVLAVDLSLASLAYALRKTRELGLGNSSIGKPTCWSPARFPGASI